MNHLNSGKNKTITFKPKKEKLSKNNNLKEKSNSIGIKIWSLTKKLLYSAFVLLVTLFISIIVIQSLIAISVQFCNTIVTSQLDVPDQNIANMSIIALTSALISWYLIGFKPYQKIDKLIKFMDSKLKHSLSTEVKEKK